MKIEFDRSITSIELIRLLNEHSKVYTFSEDAKSLKEFEKKHKFNKIFANLFDSGVIIDGDTIAFDIDCDVNENDIYFAEADIYIGCNVATPTFKFTWDDSDEYPSLVIGDPSIFSKIMDAVEAQVQP